MTNIDAHFLTDKDTPELEPKTLREKLGELYLNVQRALRDDDPPPEQRSAYEKIKNKVELIAKFGTFKNEGELITHQEARQVYALKADRISFDSDYVRAFSIFGPLTEADLKLLPFRPTKPTFEEALQQSQDWLERWEDYISGRKTAEEVGFTRVILDDDEISGTLNSKPKPG